MFNKMPHFRRLINNQNHKIIFRQKLFELLGGKENVRPLPINIDGMMTQNVNVFG